VLFIGFTVLIQVNVVGAFVRDELNVIANPGGFPLWAKILIIIVSLVVVVKGIHILMLKFPTNKLFVKTDHFFRGIGIGFKTIKNLKHRKLFLMHTFFIWTLYLLQVYLGFSAMEGTSHLGLKAAFSVLALATLAMIATPGGIGSFPFFVMQTLTMYAISQPMGKAFGWLLWGVNTGMVIVLGLIALLVLPYINKKKNEVNPPDSIEDMLTD
jgi:hypothetical protein